MMQVSAIIVLCVLAACGYGIIHDQITARICIEYFTIGHPQILKVPTESPTLLGLVWGIMATWWVGLGLGIPLAAAARVGHRPKRTVGNLVRPVVVLLAVTGTLAFFAGVVGYLLAAANGVVLSGPIAARIASERHAAFLADLFAHNMSYLAGSLGGLIVITKTWRSRGQVVA
jgi:hypothetical protein